MKKPILLIVLFVLFLGACRKEAFRLESEWLTPLFTTSLGIGDLLGDSILAQNADGSLELIIEHEETLDSLLDVLEVPDSLTEVSLSLTQLLLDDRQFSDTVTLIEIYPQAILVHGQTTVLPAQDFNTGQETEIDVTEQFFTSATFQEGYLDIEIHNDLPVEVELIDFELRNKDDNSIIVSDAFTNIAPFSSQAKSYDLSGQTVKGVMIAELKRVKTAASNGPVTIDAYKGLRLDLEVRDLKPKEATAIFPAQDLIQREDETTYDFGGPQITTMRLKSGIVLMEVYSSVNEEIILEYAVPQSKHVVTGQPIYKEFRIPAAVNGVPTRLDEQIEIGEYEITYKGKDVSAPPFYNTFYNTLNARIEYTGEERTLSLEDSIYIKFGLIDVSPSLAIGDFGQRTYDFTDPMSVPAFRDVAGRLVLDDASLDVTFMNSFGIQALLDIDQVIGIHQRENRAVALLSPELDQPIFMDRAYNRISFVDPYVTGLRLDRTNSNFKQFFQNLPDRVEPAFRVITRPNGSNNLTDFAFDTSYLKMVMALRVPLNFQADSLMLIRNEAFQWATEDLQGVKSGTLLLNVTNGFPLQTEIQLEFLNGQGEVILRKLGGQWIEAAQIGPDNKVSQSVKSRLELPLSETEIWLLEDAQRIRINARFNSPGQKNYPLYNSYTIDVQLSARFVYEND